MSYENPKYPSWYSTSSHEILGYWQAYNPEWDHVYEGQEYTDGWFSVDGDEWYGEFESKDEAEGYLRLRFVKWEDPNG